MVLENTRELWEHEQRIKKERAQRDANKLKIQRVVLEHQISGERYTFYIMGWDHESDLREFMVQMQIQNQKTAPKMGIVEQSGFMNTVDFIPKSVRKELVLSWLPELHADTKERIKKYLSGKK